MLRSYCCTAAVGFGVSAASAEQRLSSDPFSAAIEATLGAISVTALEFAKIPDAEGGERHRASCT